MPVTHHSVFTGRMSFPPPNQQRQSIGWSCTMERKPVIVVVAVWGRKRFAIPVDSRSHVDRMWAPAYTILHYAYVLYIRCVVKTGVSDPTRRISVCSRSSAWRMTFMMCSCSSKVSWEDRVNDPVSDVCIDQPVPNLPITNTFLCAPVSFIS